MQTPSNLWIFIGVIIVGLLRCLRPFAGKALSFAVLCLLSIPVAPPLSTDLRAELLRVDLFLGSGKKNASIRIGLSVLLCRDAWQRLPRGLIGRHVFIASRVGSAAKDDNERVQAVWLGLGSENWTPLVLRWRGLAGPTLSRTLRYAVGSMHTYTVDPNRP